ncbi:zinc finger protein castor homolog 1 isoform X5 [Ambystoma mexicanum]|uniref:zinc finger protein castor homolog 1 isoform X5 n=1 Tax=Ambystoma mexicanum TaxID=8296 RepID=UPI0037E938E2
MKVDYLSELGFGLSDYVERTICTDTTSGKSKMAARRKGGLKVNAICAKLSRQVGSDIGSEVTPDADPELPESCEKEQPLNTAPSEGLNVVQRIDEDKRRREVIEKWVNGEYTDEPLGRRKVEGADAPPEGVYMVQPKGCSDDEDNADDPAAPQGLQGGSFLGSRDSNGAIAKEESMTAPGEAMAKPTSLSSSASSLRDYAASTMHEFLGIFGYSDQSVKEEICRKVSFDKLNTPTSECGGASLPGEDAVSKRARFSKYEEYIRKLKAGEQLGWPPQGAKCDEMNSKLAHARESNLHPHGRTPGIEPKATILPLPSMGSAQVQGLMSRASKYDFFIQKLKTGETLRPQNGNAYKKPSKYDLENVKYLHLFKPGDGVQDMGGAIAFKTGKVGRPSKYDVRSIPKVTPVKAAPIIPSLTPAPLVCSSSTPVVTGEQTASLSFNAPEYMKAAFSKTDSITTGTVSTVKTGTARAATVQASLAHTTGTARAATVQASTEVQASLTQNRNGLPTDKPAAIEDVNIYQKYIARFSGSQHCGHIHCAYQYREHYHCLDPECNYQRFTSKQDVIRHYNMHKKRDNSLQHGFMRFSPLDDCSVYYHSCHLNGKSTHYHCMQVGCNKVYTSTSDVMTHENFHKKNTQLINDGFQRFRATEDCGTLDCQFYGQKTTHFHCRRTGCAFTFKNKCDIEKHKSYHIKDDAYAKDGFKKFYKYEECKYDGCVYSKATNHFHCIRAGCGFTFTSTSQMTSHKRKHERRHVRSAGVLGLPSSLMGSKDEPDDSSNDDLIDFSAMSSKNSSLSASPTSQQSSVSVILPGSGGCASPQASKSNNPMPTVSKISTLLSQTLPSNMPLGMALSNSTLPGASPFYRLNTSLPVSGTNLMTVISSSAAPAETPSQAGSGTSNTPSSSSLTSTSIMDRISATKGLISPMMARLAAAALKPGSASECGPGQPLSVGWLHSTHVKQEPSDGMAMDARNALQEQSLDLRVKEESNECNSHGATGTTTVLSSLMNKAQTLEAGEGAVAGVKTEPCELGEAEGIKAPEPWKTYLRRFGPSDVCDPCCDFLHKAHFHCAVLECGALFSTMDGAIKHANFHFRTDGGAGSTCPTPMDSKASLPPSPSAVVMSAPSNLEVATPSLAPLPSTPTLLAWKQLAASLPQMPQIPATVTITAASPLATTSLENAKPQVKPGFLQFQENDPCLATDCKYANKFHFHCLFGNCKYVCKTSGKAESHCLDHINPNNSLVNVRDQFAYYSLQCLCPNQHCEFRMRGHYHCLRSGCYFVTNITTKLPWHVKKHEKAERRAANGFKYFTKREECGRAGCKYNQVNSHFHCIRDSCQFSFLLKHQMTSHARKHMRRMLGKNFDRVPGQVLPHTGRSDNLSHFSSMVSSPASSGTPASFQTSQNTNDTETDEYMDYTGAGSPGGMSSESSNMDRSCSSTPVGNESTSGGNTITMPTASGAKKRFWIIEDMSPFGKRRKTASSRKMLDEGMMLEGFRRYDLYEDCKDTGCQFSLKVTHYHCTRENCGYKFCGRTHMYKHAQHHDRVDNLVLDDFKRFKSSLRCNFTDCQFSGNSTHFHCLRCGFRCTDSTKVTAHRKHHGKQDIIMAAGFCQFSSSVDCDVADCKYKLKCSHFHCTYPSCKHTVVGMSQMDSHKRKHEKQERGELPATSPGPDGLSHIDKDYTPGQSVNLDSSLNLSTDTSSALFFLQNAAGVGLNDSLDLSKKPQEVVSMAPNREETSQCRAPASQEVDDDLSQEEEDEEDMNEELEDDDEDDDEEEEEDLNTDSEDSLPEPKGLQMQGGVKSAASARSPTETPRNPVYLAANP